jgi:uridine kinase
MIISKIIFNLHLEPYIIGICGGNCAGKSEIVQIFEKNLRKKNITNIISLDIVLLFNMKAKLLQKTRKT